MPLEATKEKEMNTEEFLIKILVWATLPLQFLWNQNALVGASVVCMQVHPAAVFMFKDCFLSFSIEFKN